MFFILKNLHKEIIELKKEIKDLKENEELYIKDLEYYSDFYANFHGISECEFVIDFSQINVFSIERQPAEEDYPEKTLICYKTENSDVEEWEFYCSVDQHNKLVHEFIEYKKNINYA